MSLLIRVLGKSALLRRPKIQNELLSARKFLVLSNGIELSHADF